MFKYKGDKADLFFISLIIGLPAIGVFSIVMQYLAPPKTYTLIRAHWSCTETREIMVGRTFETQCIRLERKP